MADNERMTTDGDRPIETRMLVTALIMAAMTYSFIALIWTITAVVLVKLNVAPAGVVLTLFVLAGIVLFLSSCFAFRQRRRRAAKRQGSAG